MVFGAYYNSQRKEGTFLQEPLLSDSELDDEFVSAHRSRCRLRRPWGRNLLCWKSLAVLATLVASIQSFLVWKLWHGAQTEYLGEINGLVPAVEVKPRLFVADSVFNPLNTTDPGWLSIMPRGGGFVPVDDWQGKTLVEPIRTRGKDVYNVAIFHQLHCLHILAEQFGSLLVGARDAGHEHGHRMKDGGKMVEHANHCFEYIKESLTCCADTTLEGQNQESNLPGTNGFGAYHMCRDFDAVMNWADENRISDQEGYPH